MNSKQKNILIKLAVFISAASQLITPIFSNIGNNDFTKNDPPITPASYTFSIWGIITLLSFCYGIYQLIPNRKNEELHIKLSSSLIIVYILFSVWLFVAEKNWLILTLIVFVVMFILLTMIFAEVINENKKLNSLEKIILLSQIAMYTGWSTVAIFANLATIITAYGASISGFLGNFWQFIILIAAAFNSIYWIVYFKKNRIYILTIIWAFIGVFFGLAKFENTHFLQYTTLLATISILYISFFHKQKINS